MKKMFLISVIITVLFSFATVIALEKTINLDTIADGCLGTDCEFMESASGTVTIDDCRDKLYIDVDLSGLDPGNYQISIQTQSGDKRLDSTEVCPNPNAPMGGSHPNAWECGSWQDYSFYNFEMDALTTDGDFQKSYVIYLPEGYYDVALLVKHDKIPEGTGGANYPIILQKEHITFSVVGYCTAQQEERISALEEKTEELQEGDEKIWNKLHTVQDEIAKISADLNALISQVESYVKPKLLEIQTEIAKLWDAMPECCCGAKKCDNDDRYVCVNHKWGKQETCGHGCSDGECNAPPTTTTTSTTTTTTIPSGTENCLTKPDEYYCYRSIGTKNYYVFKKDHYRCKRSLFGSGYGTDTSCKIGYCLYTKTKVEYCGRGSDTCINGQCV